MTTSLAITTLDSLERLAKMATASGLCAVRRWEEAAYLLATGAELGLSPMQSLRGIYVVNGKPVLSSDLLVAIVRRSGLCDTWRVVESTPETCTIETRRKGETDVATRTWTIADARRAGVAGKPIWSQYPAQMLRHRCAADLVREVYPDVALGLYDPEELDADGRATPACDAIVVAASPVGALAAPAESSDEEPSSRAFAAFVARLGVCDTLAAVHDCYAALLDGLHEESADVEHWTQGDDGAGALALTRIRALGHALSKAEAATVLRDRLFAAVIDTQAPIVPGERALDQAARWWIDSRAQRAALDDAYRRLPWLPLVRRYSGATTAAEVKRAGAALEAAVKRLDGPEPTAPTTSSGGSAANDATGGGVEAGGLDGYAAHLRECRDEGHVAGAWWKRAEAFRAQGTHAKALAVTLDELARRGVTEPSAYLTGVQKRRAA